MKKQINVRGVEGSVISRFSQSGNSKNQQSAFLSPRSQSPDVKPHGLRFYNMYCLHQPLGAQRSRSGFHG